MSDQIYIMSEDHIIKEKQKDTEVISKLKIIEEKVEGLISDRGHTFIIIALIILLLRDCQL